MSGAGILTVQTDQNFNQIVAEIAKENGCTANVSLNGKTFANDYERIRPTVILYDFFTEFLDGIELTSWLIENDNTARVILTADHSLVLTRAASALAKRANRFPLSILPCPASRDEILASLKV